MEASRRQRNLITMNDEEGNSLSVDQSLLHLIDLLTRSSTQKLIQHLGEIGCILYENACDKANEILLKKYADTVWLKNLPPLKEPNGTENFLFTSQAMRLLNTLLIFNCTDRIILNLHPLTTENGLILPIETSSQNANDVPIINVFLLANQLIWNIQHDLIESGEKFLSNSAIYYSEIFDDTNSAIGRSQLLYDTDYFNEKLIKIFDMSVLEISECLFILFALVNGHKPAKIDPEFTFRKIAQNDQRAKIIKILNALSIDTQSVDIKYTRITQDLHKDFVQDKICRSKPFLKTNNQYVCIRPDLLTSAFGNFPYHNVLNSLAEIEKDEFFKEFGCAFEEYIEIISKRALGEKSETYEYIKKAYRGSRSSDRHLDISDQARAIIEIKSSRETDNVMLGSLDDLRKKFIHLGGAEDKPKGVLQLIKDVVKYRKATLFNGKIFPIIIFYGNFPETQDFDKLVQNEINTKPQYQQYLTDNKNFPTTWLSGATAELMFCAVKQNADLEELLTRIAPLTPSKVRSEILNFLSEKNLRSSLSILFEEELTMLLKKSTAMLSKN